LGSRFEENGKGLELISEKIRAENLTKIRNHVFVVKPVSKIVSPSPRWALIGEQRK
jgi:hypothetical protein